MEQGARPAATATADPEEEPPEMRGVVGSRGLMGLPKCLLSPSPENANSDRLVLPRATIPAAARFATMGASRSFGGASSNRADPAEVRAPAMSTRSFHAAGT